MKYPYERHTLAMYGLENGIEDWNPDTCVSLWQYRNRRLHEATLHEFNTGERIWAKAVSAAICEELDIDREELEIYAIAGMMVEEDRKEASMTNEERDEDRRFKAHVEEVLKETLQDFDYDAFVLERSIAEAEEVMLESMYKEDDQ